MAAVTIADLIRDRRKNLQAVTAGAEKAEKQFAELANARAAVEAKSAALEKQIGGMNAALSEAQQRTSPVGSAATGSSGAEQDATARPADVGALVATGSLGAKSPGGNKGPAPQPGSIAVGKPKTPAEEVSPMQIAPGPGPTILPARSRHPRP